MTDRVHPSSKPTATKGGATATNPSFPATKAQLYGANRPTYRPQPYNRRSSRRWCCTIFFWLILILLILLLLLGIAGTVVYLLYRPHRPSFSVISLKLSYLKLTTSNTLNSKFDLTLSATNPNKKIVFSYEPVSISILSGDVDLGDGSIPSFEHGKKNTTLLRALVSSSMQALESDAATQLEESMKSKNGLGLKLKMETKVEAKMGALKTPRVGIRVLCDGITVTLPAGKKLSPASTSNAECEVNVRFKVWKWTVG